MDLQSLTELPAQHEIVCMALGFAGGCALMGGIWLVMDIRRVLNAPQKFMDEVLAGMNKAVKT